MAFISTPDDIHLTSALTLAIILDEATGRSGLLGSCLKIWQPAGLCAWFAGRDVWCNTSITTGEATGGGVAYDGVGDKTEIRTQR